MFPFKKKKNNLDDRYWITFSCDDNDKFFVDVGWKNSKNHGHTSDMMSGLLNGLITGQLNGEVLECLSKFDNEIVQRMLTGITQQRTFLNPLDL